MRKSPKYSPPNSFPLNGQHDPTIWTFCHPLTRLIFRLVKRKPNSAFKCDVGRIYAAFLTWKFWKNSSRWNQYFQWHDWFLHIAETSQFAQRNNSVMKKKNRNLTYQRKVNPWNRISLSSLIFNEISLVMNKTQKINIQSSNYFF